MLGRSRPSQVASSSPTTAALTAARALRARARCRSRLHAGNAASSTSMPGANTATKASRPPAQPLGATERAAPTNAANVNSGPGTACAAP